MKAKDFDQKFDENTSDIVEYLNLSTARRPNREQKPAAHLTKLELSETQTLTASLKMQQAHG